MKLLDKFLNTPEHVLNPGAHGGESPLYKHCQRSVKTSHEGSNENQPL